MGLPPLARREQLEAIGRGAAAGSTSARAERTARSRQTPASSRVYLRSRGENARARRAERHQRGLPPLARREPDERRSLLHGSGSTSARAERTLDGGRIVYGREVYLRSRGENHPESRAAQKYLGLPPLARRERDLTRPTVGGSGSTSARAERTSCRAHPSPTTTVYLRSRGENDARLHARHHAEGLPPLARREPRRRSARWRSRWSTSARAERTHARKPSVERRQVYLRSRGENAVCESPDVTGRGLPLLARRERSASSTSPYVARSTSARAERTRTTRRSSAATTVYLRSRGENFASS